MKTCVTSFTVRRCVSNFASLGLLAIIAGCGAPVVEVERLNVVTGNITFADNKTKIDLADQSVVEFHPIEGEFKGRKIWGSLIEGSYSISTEEEGQKTTGAPEGDYVVTITPSKTHRLSIPVKYRDPKTSDLTAQVAEGVNTDVDFELKP
jgi:hypothetical protein